MLHAEEVAARYEALWWQTMAASMWRPEHEAMCETDRS